MSDGNALEPAPRHESRHAPRHESRHESRHASRHNPKPKHKRPTAQDELTVKIKKIGWLLNTPAPGTVWKYNDNWYIVLSVDFSKAEEIQCLQFYRESDDAHERDEVHDSAVWPVDLSIMDITRSEELRIDALDTPVIYDYWASLNAALGAQDSSLWGTPDALTQLIYFADAHYLIAAAAIRGSLGLRTLFINTLTAMNGISWWRITMFRSERADHSDAIIRAMRLFALYMIAAGQCDILELFTDPPLNQLFDSRDNLELRSIIAAIGDRRPREFKNKVYKLAALIDTY